jgi:hypothetical protein
MAKMQLPEDIRAFFVSQGSKGGKVGGRKRMEALTPEERTELAKKAVAAREAKRAKAAPRAKKAAAKKPRAKGK